MVIITQIMHHNEWLKHITAEIMIMIITADYNRTDVSLEHIFDWTSYCKYHSHMNAPQYV